MNIHFVWTRYLIGYKSYPKSLGSKICIFDNSAIRPFLIRTTKYALPNLTSFKICITWLLYAPWSLSCHGYGFLLHVTVESPIILASNYRDAENPTSLLGHIYWRSRRKNEFIGARLLRNFPWEKQPLVLTCGFVCEFVWTQSVYCVFPMDSLYFGCILYKMGWETNFR